MGGYTNYSAEENAAYAEKTGTVNIGVGSEWAKAATDALSKNKDATNLDVMSALGRTSSEFYKKTPLNIGDDINKRAWAAGYPGRTPTLTEGTQGEFEGVKYSEMKEVTPDGRGNLQYTGRTLDGLKINTDSAGNETFTRPTPAITFEKLQDVIGTKPYITDPKYDKFTQSSKEGGGYTGLGQYRVTQQGITHEGTLYGSPYGAGQLVDKSGRIVSSWSEGGGIFLPESAQTVIAINEANKKRNNVMPDTPSKPKDTTIPFTPSIQSILAAGLTIDNNIVYKNGVRVGSLDNKGVFTVGKFGAPTKRTNKQPAYKTSPKPIRFMDIFSSARKTTPDIKTPKQSIKRGSGLSYTSLLECASKSDTTRKPTKPVKTPIKKPTHKKKDIGFGNAYEVLFSNNRRK